MAEKIYALNRFRARETWFQLSEKERKSFVAQHDKFLEGVGAELIVRLRTVSSQWRGVDLFAYPNMEAYQKYWNAFSSPDSMGATRYFEVETTVCIDVPQ